MKPYCGNQRPFVYAMFSDKDRGQAISVMEKISESGVSFWSPEKFSKTEEKKVQAAFSCILFISNNSAGDENIWRIVDSAVKYNKKILCIYLEQTVLSPGQKLRMGSTQSLNIDEFPNVQAFIEKLKSAEVFSDMKMTDTQKRFARRRALASVFIPITAAVVIFFAVVVPLLIIPASVSANGALSRLGFGNLSLEELAKIEKLYVIGNRTFDQKYDCYYTTEAKNEVYLSGVRAGGIPVGDISDISDLSLLKNAKEIAFEGNQVWDITPLFKIKTLEKLTLNCNPVKSIEGIEALQNLKSITLGYTDISDISPLFKLSSIEYICLNNTHVSNIEGIEALQNLKNIILEGTDVNDISPLFYISSLTSINFQSTNVSSIEGIEKLKNLNALDTGWSKLTDITPLKNIDFSFLNDTGGFSFLAKNSIIRDLSPLQGIPKFNLVLFEFSQVNSFLPYISNKQVSMLYILSSDINNINQLSSIKKMESLCLIRNDQLTSIDGIENHTELSEVTLVDCPNITDLTPLLKLTDLKCLIISPEMEILAKAQLAGASFKIEEYPKQSKEA